MISGAMPVAVASNVTTYSSPGTWEGETVHVTADGPCPVPGHELGRWIRTDGLDTGYLYCNHCGGVADQPGAFDCGVEGDGGWCNMEPGHGGPHRFVTERSARG